MKAQRVRQSVLFLLSCLLPNMHNNLQLQLNKPKGPVCHHVFDLSVLVYCRNMAVEHCVVKQLSLEIMLQYECQRNA